MEIFVSFLIIMFVILVMAWDIQTWPTRAGLKQDSLFF